MPYRTNTEKETVPRAAAYNPVKRTNTAIPGTTSYTEEAMRLYIFNTLDARPWEMRREVRDAFQFGLVLR